MGKFIKSTAGRRWLYGVALAAVALAGAYGLITEELGVLWVGVVAALLGLPVAAGNVPNAGVEAPADDLITDSVAGHFTAAGPAAYPVPEAHPVTEADPERYER